MKLVFLDYHTLDPHGDVSWKPLTDLPVEIIRHERTELDDLFERIRDAEIVLTNKVRFSEKTLSTLDNLRYIGVMGAGFDVIDVKAARLRGIRVTNVPGYASWSGAQHTFALLLELTNHVQGHAQSVAAGEWSCANDWSYFRWPVIELANKVIGVVGYGEIGKAVGRIAASFGMKVLHSSTHLRSDPSWRPFPELLTESDVISLHCPLTPQTSGMINTESLKRIRPRAFLLNTARGSLIIEQDLADALNNGRIAGAGLDVLPEEPPRRGSPLISAKNCLITSHLAWATREARQRLLCTCALNIEAFLNGQSLNVVN